MDYKVCILAAGIGSRMDFFTKTFNKAMIPIKGKPVICHIIEKFPENIEIVIALGYKKETIKDYLTIAYPNRKITFVEVDKFTGPGTGPGYSLIACKISLQCPFIFLSVDTLVKENIPSPEKNWFGLAPVLDTSRFCSAKIDDSSKNILKIDDKLKVEGNLAFIGLAGICDYQHFWQNLASNKQIIAGEIQVSNGFQSLLEKEMKGQLFTWFDTGTLNSYKHALENYPNGRGYNGL